MAPTLGTRNITTTFRRRSHMPRVTSIAENDQRYIGVITEMTDRGKTAKEISAVVGFSRDWVDKFRIRNNIELPRRRGRPRLTDGRRERQTSRQQLPETQRPENVPPGTYPVFKWTLPLEYRLNPDTKAIILIPPVREAQPASPTRRVTFDIEDTGEL